MDLGIKGRVALVTGGSRGLGRQVALSLAREGARVAICARGEEGLKATVAELQALGADAVGVPADVSRPETPEQVCQRVEHELGPIDILVNNVGGSLGTPRELADVSLEQFDKVLQVNLHVTLRFMKLAIPGMRQRKWGRIVNISSVYGREYGGAVAYMTAKAAVIALSKHAALSLAKDNVLVNSIAPGSTLFPGGSWDRFVKQNPKETVGRFVEQNLPMGRFNWPEPIGDLVAFLASERAGTITGACINVDGGQSRSLF